MNIINQQYPAASFRGFGRGVNEAINLSRRGRIKLAEFYPTIRDSKVIDLDRTIPNGDYSNYFFVKVKETIPKLLDGIHDLVEGSVLKFYASTHSECEGSKIICKDVIVNDERRNVVLDMGTKETAERVIKDFKIWDAYDDFVPQFAALIDLHTKIQPLLKEIKNVTEDVLSY